MLIVSSFPIFEVEILCNDMNLLVPQYNKIISKTVRRKYETPPQTSTQKKNPLCNITQ
jgi:hypothetical protein